MLGHLGYFDDTTFDVSVEALRDGATGSAVPDGRAGGSQAEAACSSGAVRPTSDNEDCEPPYDE